MTQRTYPTDLTDAQWDNLFPYLPEPSSIGRPLKWEMRSIINAIFYLGSVYIFLAVISKAAK